MGWLELIPLLKRLLPLLSRVAPMLEAFVVARASGGRDTEAAVDRVASELKREFATAAEKHAALAQTMAEHTEQLRMVSGDVQRLHLASSEHDARMEAMEAQVAALAGTLKGYAVAVILLLILCVTLLVAIFLRH